jgi:glycosyltransferase involved in cell wall biosynthesis
MRVALIHDWLTGLRGGEKVLEVFCELFPDATLFTLVHIPGSTSPVIESVPIRTAFTQNLPGVKKHYRWYLPLYPWAIGSLDFKGFDLLISSSHCVAKGAKAPPGAMHICYCHTPMRYIWDRFSDYFGTGLKARIVYEPIARLLRRWDVSSSARVHHFVANSRHVADRILKFYGRLVDAVFYPPVDTDFFLPCDEGPDDYYLIVSALVPYKRLDLAIDCFNRRREPLYIVGTGPEAERLRARSGPTIRFLGSVDQEELRRLYQRARATLLPGVEDFGIVPVESQACGRPVVARARGGATESVQSDRTGVLFEEPTVEALSHAVDKVSSLRFNKTDLRDWALGFSRERFKSSFKHYIEGKLSSGTTKTR